MTLASFADANRYLDTNKIRFENADDATPEATAADNLIKSKLFVVFGSLVNDWDFDGTPALTPPLVLEIAAMQMACRRYAKKYAEEVEAESSYGGRLCSESSALLDQLASGDITLAESPAGASLGSPEFFPTDTDPVDVSGNPLRFATMDKEF